MLQGAWSERRFKGLRGGGGAAGSIRGSWNFFDGADPRNKLSRYGFSARGHKDLGNAEDKSGLDFSSPLLRLTGASPPCA